MTHSLAIDAVALYGGVLGLLLVFMIFAIIRLRWTLKVSIGDGGEKILAKAMRGQANFVETATLGMILLLLIALVGAPVWVVHLMGLALVVGRLLHASVFFMGAHFRLRQMGMVITALYLILASAGLILHALV